MASNYFGINAGITYGNAPILANNAGIVDTGATFISMVTGAYLECRECSSSHQCSIDAYDAYQDATGADVDPRNGRLTITPAQYNALQPLNFHVGDVRLFLFQVLMPL